MAAIPPLELEDAPEQTRAVYRDFQERMALPAPPNFIKTQGHSLMAARATWNLTQEILLGGLLPRSIKELLMAAISVDRGCRYCEAVHLACCRMLGVDSATLERLTENLEAVHPERVRDILRFAIKCAREPRSLTADDFESLRSHGFLDSEIVEVISMAAFAVYANTIADATGMETDEMLTQLEGR